MWYVIQTETGREELAKMLIEGIIPDDLFEACRIVMYETKRKYEGKWHIEKRKMFPGYLFLKTEDIDRIFFALKKVPRFTKLLRPDQKMSPLYESEAEVLERLTGDGNVVEMSVGVREGQKIKVVRGCLQGMEPRIVKVDRHKRKAVLEIEMFGEKRNIEVGLEIIC